MNFLLENRVLVTDEALFEHDKYDYAGVFTKVNSYNRRARAAINESAYFTNRFAYNPDIMFTLNEQSAISDMLCQMRAHLMEQMDIELKTTLINEGL